MAIRHVYVPITDNRIGVRVIPVEFTWFPGLSTSQKQKSIRSLHAAAIALNIGEKPLEISSKSETNLGVQLSAFNLQIVRPRSKKTYSVECAFQSSKVFEHGGPYCDILNMSSREAKKDPRLKSSGKLIRFEYSGRSFPTNPTTLFYDWLYINALDNSTIQKEELIKHDIFTDIEFNPKKSLNCQAYSAALYVSLVKTNNLKLVTSGKEQYIENSNSVYTSQRPDIHQWLSIPL